MCVDPDDYDALLASLGQSQDSLDAVNFRKHAAWKTYAHCAAYDSMVNDWYWQQIGKAARSRLTVRHGKCLWAFPQEDQAESKSATVPQLRLA